MHRTAQIICALILFTNPLFSLVPSEYSEVEIRPDTKEKYYSTGKEYISIETGKPIVLYNLDYEVYPDTPQKMAEQYLKKNADYLGINKENANYVYKSERHMPGGHRVRFKYLHDNIEVYQGDITVSLTNDYKVVFVINRYKDIPQDFRADFTIDENRAEYLAKVYLGQDKPFKLKNVEKVIYAENKFTQAAIKLELMDMKTMAYWEILVNAKTGEIISAEDKACYANGYVFDADPVTRNQARYGEPGFLDNNDANNDTLQAALVEVDLGEIASENGLYYLRNERAWISDFNPPYSGEFAQESDDFRFSRDHDSFEAVNIFYHINQSMSYLNDSLFLYLYPLQYAGGVRFDPDGLDGAQNAMYSGGMLIFGNPPDHVDAGESHAIVHHELGHGIHDWITGLNLSQVDGLSEGIADYWAQSYTRSLGYYTPEDEQYDWFVVWGLHPWGEQHYMRTTDYDGHYPEDLVGNVHDDGQMWSSSLMTIYDLIGKRATDRILLESLSMTDGQTDQPTAARAFIEADLVLYEGSHLNDILPVFVQRGYLEDIVEPHFYGLGASGQAPLTVSFFEYSIAPPGAIIGWEWDLDGDGVADAHGPRPEWTYEELGSYDVTLTVFTANNSYSKTIADFVVVYDQALVWEYLPGDNSCSGEFIKEYFDLYVEEEIVYTQRLPMNYRGLQHLFISIGNAGEDLNSEDNVLLEIVDYLSGVIWDGVNVYLEGGSPFQPLLQTGNDYVYEEFSDYFKFISSYTSEIEDPINQMSGQNSSIAEGMCFYDSNQQENYHIEYYNIEQSSTRMFIENGLGVVGFQSESEFDGKNVILSYTISQLSPNGSISTKEELMYRICTYFGLHATSGVEDTEIITPDSFKLHSCFPNPFNSETVIRYDLPEESKVSLKIYDVLGRETATLISGKQTAGQYKTRWSGSHSLSSGIYFLVMKTEGKSGKNQQFTQKLVYMK